MLAVEFYRRAIGALIGRLPCSYRRATIESALWHFERIAYERLRDRGFCPTIILDIGACSGEWTRLIKTVFPSASVLMIEARDEARPELETVAADYSNVRAVIALLGERQIAHIGFHSHTSGSSVYRERSNVDATLLDLPMTTLDAIAGSVEGPLFIKLDVQGSELAILRGASNTLEKAEVVQIEMPVLEYNEGAPQFHEVAEFMAANNFAPYDVAGFSRPFGDFLAQVDLIFTRANSALRPKSFNFT
jgi:FkbM family methyltransferase